MSIVCTQMTKTGVFTFGTGGDHISDLNIALRDNNPVDQEFHQLPLLFKAGIRQSAPHTLTELFHRCNQGRSLIVTVHLCDQLRFLVSKGLYFLLHFTPTTLVFRQRNHLSQIRFGQSVKLLLQLSTATSQIVPPRLQLLRQPRPAMGTLERVSNAFRMLQHVTKVLPYQLVKLLGGRKTRGTLFLPATMDGLGFSSTNIITILALVQRATGA
jgi:hypothetical protein